MFPSRYSDKNTIRNGVTRSFIPWTYPLAGWRIALKRVLGAFNHEGKAKKLF